MFAKSINYAVRALLVIIGFLLFFGLIPNANDADPTLLKTIGAVLFLFGIYRLALYRLQIKRKRYDDDDDD